MEEAIPKRTPGLVILLLLVWVVLSLLVAATGLAVGVMAFPYHDHASPPMWMVALMCAGLGGLGGSGVCYYLTISRRGGQGQGSEALALERHTGLEGFARSLSLIVGADELYGNQIGKIRALVDAEQVALLVANVRGDRYTIQASRGYGEVDLAAVGFHDNARLVKWLYANETYLVPSENPGVMAYLYPEERECLKMLRVDVVFPLVALNRLVGLIFITRKGGLSRVQTESISSLTPQMALAIENAALYEQQRVRIRRLYRAERLAIVGQLAAGAAHEIRNPLTSIRSTVQYLKRSLERDPTQSRRMEDLLGEVDRINATVEGLLTLARPADLRLEKVDLCDLVAQAARLVEATARKGRVEIETRFPQDSVELQADPSQLKQVFLNVMINALQAMPDGGKLSVRISRLGRPSGKAQWKVEIADTGVGIPEEHREKVFDPFFTTKREGTGLGLPICHSILQSHGGEIDVEGATGKGTRVEIRL